MPSPLFNFLFLVALIVPLAMYVIGLLFLFASLIAKEWRAEEKTRHAVEATAH